MRGRAEVDVDPGVVFRNIRTFFLDFPLDLVLGSRPGPRRPPF
jgi:hypothetical protein